MAQRLTIVELTEFARDVSNPRLQRLHVHTECDPIAAPQRCASGRSHVRARTRFAREASVATVGSAVAFNLC